MTRWVPPQPGLDPARGSRNHGDALWLIRLAALEAFYAAHGAAPGPRNRGEESALSGWMLRQRLMSRRGQLSPARTDAWARLPDDLRVGVGTGYGRAPRAPRRVPLIPTAPGSPERRQLILDLAAQGVTHQQIAATVGVSTTRVAQVLGPARDTRKPRPTSEGERGA